MDKIKNIASADYYAEAFFKKKNLKHVHSTYVFGSECPFCAVELSAVESYIFEDVTTAEKIRVHVNASYLTCPCCGYC